MSLDKWGELFFGKMRPFFFFALVVLPLLAAALFICFEYSQLKGLQDRFTAAARKEKIAFERKARKERLIQRYCHANPYFLDQQIESLPLLQRELEQLKSLLPHPAFPNHQSIRDRSAFLVDNRLVFAEEQIRTSSQIKEVEEKQRRPVEMDENDLKKILSIIEDVSIDQTPFLNDRPQILIKDFHLKKQKTSLQTEVFEVEMDLLKREFIKP